MDRESTRLITNALAESTKRKYEAIQQRFLNFCKDLKEQPCPCSALTVLRFLAEEKETRGAGGAPGTLAAIRNLHTMNGSKTEALDDPRIKLIRLGLAKDSGMKVERDPISSEDLRKICSGLSLEEGGPIMLKAAMCLGFFGLLRIGEITAGRKETNPTLTLSSLTWKECLLEVKLWKSKSDRTRKGVTVIVPKTGSSICPFSAMKRYLRVRSQRESNALFLWPDGTPLTGWDLREELKAGCLKAGIQGNINGHSLRIGGATALAKQGVSVEQIMQHGRWKSDSFRRYIRNPEGSLAEVAGLLDN